MFVPNDIVKIAVVCNLVNGYNGALGALNVNVFAALAENLIYVELIAFCDYH